MKQEKIDDAATNFFLIAVLYHLLFSTIHNPQYTVFPILATTCTLAFKSTTSLVNLDKYLIN